MRDSGHPASAALLYQQAIELGSDQVGIRKQLGNMLKDSGQYGDAYYQYSRCLEIDPADGDTLLQLGHLFKLQGDLEKAAGFYTRAASSPATEANAREELDQLAQARVAPQDMQGSNADFTSAQDGPVGALARFVQELSARVDGLTTGVSSSGNVVSREDHVAIQEIRNNWYAVLPMFLNTASTIATISGHLDTLSARVQRLEELSLGAAPPGAALVQSDTSLGVSSLGV